MGDQKTHARYHACVPIRIRSLHRYPLKGSRGIDVDSLRIENGLIVGDRSLMLIDAATGAFVSQRHVPGMARLVVSDDAISFDGASTAIPLAGGPPRSVDVWGDRFDALDLGDDVSRTLSGWLGRDLRLVKLPARSPRAMDSDWTRGQDVRTSFADLAPVLVTNAASLDELNRRRELAGLDAVPMARFRANIVVDGIGPFEEDRIGALRHAFGATIELVKPCARCKVIEIDQSTGTPMRDELLSTLAGFRTIANAKGKVGVMFGQNAIVVHDGPVELSVGDELEPR
jgi:hypothetical protein